MTLEFNDSSLIQVLRTIPCSLYDGVQYYEHISVITVRNKEGKYEQVSRSFYSPENLKAGFYLPAFQMKFLYKKQKDAYKGMSVPVMCIGAWVHA